MTENFVIYHLSEPGDVNLALPDRHWHMATCLRSIVVTDQGLGPKTTSLNKHKVMVGDEAYEFLLRVICGLESPMLGETEVLGQFKDFLKSHDFGQSSPMSEVLENLTRDAKKIRATFLQNLGCTSYGSLIRKNMGKSQLGTMAIIGAGSLAQDIFPWFAKSAQSLLAFTRNPAKYQDLSDKQDNLQLMSLPSLNTLQGADVLVVAAPITSQELQRQIDLSQFRKVFDLRGNSHEDQIPARDLTTLQDLFSNIEKNKQQALIVKRDAAAAIKEKAMSLSLLEKQRPFGWEDLWIYA